MVLSDLHLANPGRGAGSAEAVRPLWAGADECVLNGDIAEIADEKLRGAAARQVMKLLEYAEADGVKLTMISGNHDPLITDRRYLRLANREVFLTHGDILHPAISPWTEHAKELRRLHADAVLSLDPSKARDMDHQLAACQHASATQWDLFVKHGEAARQNAAPRSFLPRHFRSGRLGRKAATAMKVAKALYFWHTIPRRAMGFAARFAPESRFFIFGHIHRAGIWRDTSPGTPNGGRFIINTGAYQTPRNPRAVVMQGTTLEVWPVVYDLAGHRLGARPIATHTLQNPITAARAEGVDDMDVFAA